MRLFGVGYGADMPFIHRYDWVLPTITVTGIIAVIGLTVWLLTRGQASEREHPSHPPGVWAHGAGAWTDGPVPPQHR